jgi:hypothetical protein
VLLIAGTGNFSVERTGFLEASRTSSGISKAGSTSPVDGIKSIDQTNCDILSIEPVSTLQPVWMFLRSQYMRASTRVTSSGIQLSTALCHNLQASSFATTLAPSNSTNKISSSRTNQIARHLSSSSPFSNTTPNINANMASQYTTRKIGAPNTLEHRIYLEKDGVPISPFHDIPLYANEQQTILNMVVEIPRWTNAKMEVCSPVFLSSLCCLCNPSKPRYHIHLQFRMIVITDQFFSNRSARSRT